MSLILPQTTLNLLENVPVANRHPGLQLDKLSEPGDQTVQKRALADVVTAANGQSSPAGEFENLRKRWLANLNAAAGASPFKATTVGPLALHLARASALENAGICLHSLYGFAYLPGSGLKGMARAYAETVWLPAQQNQEQAWRQIQYVFGWAPGSDRGKNWKPSGIHKRDKNDNAHVGGVVFHDGWPEKWPQLIIDIVNNHHPDYYQAALDDNNHPPGDWENPVPVYFLAVKPGATFAFPLAKRRADVTDELLGLAREWLLGALCHLGAGAKTAAGYGAFKPVDTETPKLPSQSRVAFETTLELVTPAFLAGANQQADDCDLRPATLRGQLRWWWRTMHAGFLDVKILRVLEAAIWGDTKGGGAVRIVVDRVTTGSPQIYDKRSKANFNDQQKVSDIGILNGDARKTTQGLWYVSYGMDEVRQNNRRQRQVLEPPASWRVRLIARRSRFDNDGPETAAQQVLEQAQAALWLLCQFGGVGSKAGKGFGSLSMTDLDDLSLDKVKSHGSALRGDLNLNNSFNDSIPVSASLEQMLDPIEVPIEWLSIWSILDQIGFAYQSFAKKYKHKREKLALGLPRRIGNPAQGTFQPTSPVTTNGRHTSPVRIHVGRNDGGYFVLAIAFPAAHLPNLAASRTFLNEFLKDFGGDMQRRATLQPPPPANSTVHGGSTRGPGRPSPTLPTSSARVRVKFLGPHDKLKNAFWVQEAGKKRGLLKYGTAPGQLPALDSEIEVYQTNDNQNSPEYRWDRPPSAVPPQGGRGGKPPRGNRR